MRNVYKSLLIASVLVLAASLANAQKLAADVVKCPALIQASFHEALKNAVEDGRKSYMEIEGGIWWIDTDMVEELKSETASGKRYIFDKIDRKVSIKEKKIRCTYYSMSNRKLPAHFVRDEVNFTLTYQL